MTFDGGGDGWGIFWGIPNLWVPFLEPQSAGFANMAFEIPANQKEGALGSSKILGFPFKLDHPA